MDIILCPHLYPLHHPPMMRTSPSRLFAHKDVTYPKTVPPGLQVPGNFHEGQFDVQAGSSSSSSTFVLERLRLRPVVECQVLEKETLQKPFHPLEVLPTSSSVEAGPTAYPRPTAAIRPV
ncbi:unnamed protein product [Durusdinium trenchii]|uniref:Uncharacterized protein n=1 Tax=Durusdinium trenchii TaxID=1381693 RepID=A0ABP0M6E3_9DINO